MAAPRLLRLHAAFGGTDPVDGVSAPGLVLPAGAAADWNGLALPRCRFGGTSEFREFPGVVAAPAGEGEPVEEEFRIGGEAYRVSDPLPDARLGDEHEDPPPAFAAVDERIDATLDFARERVDRGRLVDAATGDGRLPRGRLLDTAGLVAAWQASFDPTVAPRRLVVRLAEALEDTLRDLARRPRRVLRRRREMQPSPPCSRLTPPASAGSAAGPAARSPRRPDRGRRCSPSSAGRSTTRWKTASPAT